MPGLDRVAPLLRPDVRAQARELPEGYIDLLGGTGPASTGLAQDLMVSSLVPQIYERWWRPALGRVAKGAFGPGMAEERRIARLEALAFEGEERGPAQPGERELPSIRRAREHDVADSDDAARSADAAADRAAAARD